MEVMPKYESVANSERVRLGSSQAIIECKLPVTDNGAVSKILCASAKSYIINSASNLNEVEFNGNVNFQVIYEGDDKVASSLDYTAEFKDKFVSDKITPTTTIIVNSNVVDVNTSTIGNDVKVVAIVEICVDAIELNEINALVGVDGDSVFTKTEELTYSTFLGILSNKFDLSFDIEVKDNIYKVLEVSLSPFIKKVDNGNKIATIVGGANVDICYLINGEAPLLKTYQTTIDFSEEVELDGLTEQSCIQSNLNINYSSVKVTTNIDADNAIVNLNIPFDYLGYAFEFNTTDVITDVFSLSNHINVATSSIANLQCGGRFNETNKVSGFVNIDDVFIDEVLGTCCNTVTLATSIIKDNTLILEGVASTTVIYLNKETQSMYSALVEMPFSISDNVNNVGDDFLSNITLSLGEVSCRLKRGSELEVNATLFVYADFFGKKVDAVITSVEVEEEKTDNLSVLTIYVVKQNETIWDIAKQLNVSPDDLLNQNPEVLLPLTGGEKLIVYRQKEVLF